jgi:stearoyl-CoA desaturase (delta-9 desaturase)
VPGIVVAILVGLGITQVGLLLTTVVLHRALSHRAITISGPAYFVCRIVIWTMTGIRPRQWVAVHRKHHAYTDVPGDPHSPVLVGFAAVQFGNVVLYRRVARDPATVARYARDLQPDRWDRLLFDHAFAGLVLGALLLCAVLGWELGLVAAGVHAVSYLLGNAAINAIGHQWGRRPHGGRATNNRWLALLVAGEGLHNNHHARTTSSRMSMAKGEVDPGWWAVWLLVKLRWATLRHEKLAVKPSRA